jgi:hypothetical protein
MTDMTLPAAAPRFSEGVLALLARLVFPRPAKPDPEPDDSRDRRDFVLEMMDGCPHAFASELDVQCMMHLYPGRY